MISVFDLYNECDHCVPNVIQNYINTVCFSSIITYLHVTTFLVGYYILDTNASFKILYVTIN